MTSQVLKNRSKKFAIDKRKAHFSNLIFSGQISKIEAMELMNKELYNHEELKRDMNFVLKKLDFTASFVKEVDALLNQSPTPN